MRKSYRFCCMQKVFTHFWICHTLFNCYSVYSMLLLYKLIMYEWTTIGGNTMHKIYNADRYNKNQMLFIDDREIRLIDYLCAVRKEKKITKKKISNLIKHNNYWYSQIEQTDKDDSDQRQKTIYRDDLINVISIIIFNASNSAELKDCFLKSRKYVDDVLKLVPCTETIKGLEMYHIRQDRTDPERERLLFSLLETQSRIIKQTYDSLYYDDKDRFLNCLQDMNKNLRIDPTFIISLAGLPYMDFLYESQKKRISELLTEVRKEIQTFDDDIRNGKTQSAKQYYTEIENIIADYIGKDSYDGLVLQLERDKKKY